MSATHVAFSAVRMDPTWTAMGQAAGAAAVLSVRKGVDVRNLPLEALQRELRRQKCRLALTKAALGYPDRLFRPDAAVNRAEIAALVTRTLGLWPSVSGLHFVDVPYSHWAFRDVETLFDRRLLEAFGIFPRWQQAGQYAARKHAGFARSALSREFKPAQAVVWKELIQMLGAYDRGREEAAAEDPAAWVRRVPGGSEFGRPLSSRSFDLSAPVKRGEACALLAALIDPERSAPVARAGAPR